MSIFQRVGERPLLKRFRAQEEEVSITVDHVTYLYYEGETNEAMVRNKEGKYFTFKNITEIDLYNAKKCRYTETPESIAANFEDAYAHIVGTGWLEISEFR